MDSEKLVEFKRLMDDVVVQAEAARNEVVDNPRMARESLKFIQDDVEAALEKLKID